MGKLLNNLKRTAYQAGAKIKYHSPEIMIAVGIIGTITAGVMACKATLKVEGVIDTASTDLNEIKEDVENGVISADDSKKAITKVYIQTGMAFAKLYGPAVTLGALSLATVFGSNHILRKRNASLTAAYTTLDGMYNRYRKNVRETYGEQVDYNMRYGIRTDKVEFTDTDDNGKEKKITKKITHIDPEMINNEYALWMSESTSCEWDKSEEYLLSSLRIKESVLRDMLISRGYLFLNEVRKTLGFDEIPEGQIIGWTCSNNEADVMSDWGLGFNYDEPFANMYYNDKWERGVLFNLTPDGCIINSAFKKGKPVEVLS